MFAWLKRTRSLNEALCKEFPVKVHGVLFKLRKLDPLAYVAGTKALQMHFETYKTEGQKKQLAEAIGSNPERVKEHIIDVIMYSVVEPKLSRKDNDEGIFVEKLFSDMDLVDELYLKIIEVSFGKKKLNRLRSHATA